MRLTRDVESGQQVYMQLLNKQQELKITEASTVGDVRIVDPAITQRRTEAEESADYPRQHYPRPDALHCWCAAALAVQPRYRKPAGAGRERYQRLRQYPALRMAEVP